MDNLINNLPFWVPIVLVVLMIWNIPWKGYALWKAARNNSPVWFVVLLLVNTIGILDILFIYKFSRKGEKLKYE